MFFIISKILAFLISPLNWVIILVLITFFIKKTKIKKQLRIVAFIVLVFFSNSFLSNTALKIWEVAPVRVNQLQNEYDYVVVLGGMAGWNKLNETVNFHESADRLFQALPIYKSGKANKIVIAGGSAKLIKKERKEAEILKDYLISIEFDSSDILIDTNSRNTYENAMYSKQLMTMDSLKPNVLLITSAGHMRRASACFDHVGVEHDAFPTDFHSNTSDFNPVSVIMPSAAALQTWEHLFKEWIGLTAYKLKGYI